MSADLACHCPVLERYSALKGINMDCGRMATAEDGLCDGCRTNGHGAGPKRCQPPSHVHVVGEDGFLAPRCACGQKETPDGVDRKLKPGVSFTIMPMSPHVLPKALV